MPGSVGLRQGRHIGLLREVRELNLKSVSARLSAAGVDGIPENGFDDIPDDGAVVLLAISMNGSAPAETTRKAGLSEHTTQRVIGALLQAGYVERTGGTESHQAVRLTMSGRTVLAVASEGLMIERWAGLELRPGDIVVCTPPKSGTTWLQMICALLIFQTPDLPAPLDDLSPWLDEVLDPGEELYALLAAQRHRRFIKAHMPLSEMPADPRVTYIVTARHPLDAAASLYRQLDVKGHTNRSEQTRIASREWLLGWIDAEPPAPARPNSLTGMLWRLREAWARRDDPHVVLLHYEDLSADLEGQMRQLASRLAITVPKQTWPTLVKAATFDQMRAAARRHHRAGHTTVPEALYWKGTSGAGRTLLTQTGLAHYHARVARQAPPDLLDWLHRAPAEQAGAPNPARSLRRADTSDGASDPADYFALSSRDANPKFCQ